ncbi:MAG TPA: glycosyltransferase [Candidatus Binatia bacterium]|nr:glycosyltransferase [Candidatus Binatia bacterium]
MPAVHRLSVVIPALNNWFLTQRCLTNLFEHAADTLAEVVVVDNGSTDETPTGLRAFASVKAMRFEENRGFAAACNAGARASAGEAILFLNNDAFAKPGALRALLDALGDETVGVVGARLLYGDGTLQHAGMAVLPDGRWWHLHKHLEGDLPDALITRDYAAVTGAVMVVRRSVFDALGGFDERFRNGYEDVDLCLRTWQLGMRVRYEPRASFAHLEGSTPGRGDHEDLNLTLFRERWASVIQQLPKFQLDPTPPMAVVGEITRGDIDSQVARQFLLGYESQWGAVRYYRHRPLAAPLSTVIPHFLEATFEPALSFEWGEDVPPTHGLKRIVCAAPRDLSHAASFVHREYDWMWAPTRRCRALLIEAGLPEERVEIVETGIACRAFFPDVQPYGFGLAGLVVLAFVGEYTTDAALEATLETAAHIPGDVTLALITTEPQAWLAERVKVAQVLLERQGLSLRMHVASTAHLPDGVHPSFFTGAHVYLSVGGGDPYGYAVLAAMASGSLIAALAEAPASEFLSEDWAIIGMNPAELGHAIGRTTADAPAVVKLRTMARFAAARYFSAAKAAERSAALARRYYWGLRSGESAAMSGGLEAHA